MGPLGRLRRALKGSLPRPALPLVQPQLPRLPVPASEQHPTSAPFPTHGQNPLSLRGSHPPSPHLMNTMSQTSAEAKTHHMVPILTPGRLQTLSSRQTPRLSFAITTLELLSGKCRFPPFAGEEDDPQNVPLALDRTAADWQSPHLPPLPLPVGWGGGSGSSMREDWGAGECSCSLHFSVPGLYGGRERPPAGPPLCPLGSLQSLLHRPCSPPGSSLWFSHWQRPRLQCPSRPQAGSPSPPER